MKELFKQMHERILGIVEKHRSLPNLSDKQKQLETDFLKNIRILCDDIQKEIEKGPLSMPSYDTYLRELEHIAANSYATINTGALWWSSTTKNDLPLKARLEGAIEDLKEYKARYLENEQKVKSANEMDDLKNQLAFLTDIVKSSNETSTKLSQQLEKAVTELKKAESELKTTQTNLQQFGNVIKTVTIEAADDSTYEQLIMTLKQLQLPQPNVKKLITAQSANAFPEIKASKQIADFYAPFDELKEEEFLIEGFDPALFKDTKKLNSWKTDPESKIAYEKLKLSESGIYADMYAAIIILGQFRKTLGPKNSTSFYKPDLDLIEATESVLTRLIENRNKPWKQCKQEIIEPALLTAPTSLKLQLERILSFDHQNDITHANLYDSTEKKITALGSVICYPGSDEKAHLFYRIEAIGKNINNELRALQIDSANATPRAVFN